LSVSETHQRPFSAAHRLMGFAVAQPILQNAARNDSNLEIVELHRPADPRITSGEGNDITTIERLS